MNIRYSDLFNKDNRTEENHHESQNLQHYSIGVDGCKGGWICASVNGEALAISRFPSISDIMKDHAGSVQAVYAESVSEAYLENQRILGKKFTPLTAGIIPKIREVDIFLQNNPQYKNKLMESHPEVCFASLNGKTIQSKKNELDGIREIIMVLRRYFPIPVS